MNPPLFQLSNINYNKNLIEGKPEASEVYLLQLSRGCEDHQKTSETEQAAAETTHPAPPATTQKYVYTHAQSHTHDRFNAYSHSPFGELQLKQNYRRPSR